LLHITSLAVKQEHEDMYERGDDEHDAESARLGRVLLPRPRLVEDVQRLRLGPRQEPEVEASDHAPGPQRDHGQDARRRPVRAPRPPYEQDVPCHKARHQRHHREGEGRVDRGVHLGWCGGGIHHAGGAQPERNGLEPLPEVVAEAELVPRLLRCAQEEHKHRLLHLLQVQAGEILRVAGSERVEGEGKEWFGNILDRGTRWRRGDCCWTGGASLDREPVRRWRWWYVDCDGCVKGHLMGFQGSLGVSYLVVTRRVRVLVFAFFILGLSSLQPHSAILVSPLLGQCIQRNLLASAKVRSIGLHPLQMTPDLYLHAWCPGQSHMHLYGTQNLLWNDGPCFKQLPLPR